LCGILVAIAAEGVHADEPPAGDPLRAAPEIVEAWKDLRFGMFICWGPVTLTGQEIGWSRGAPPWGLRPGMEGGKGPTPVDVYDNLYKQWQPDKFDAHEWVRVAQETGAKYIILLVKHHDGFCLFDTQLTEYRSTGPASAWKRDVLKEMADACHRAGMKLIIYYSQPDWHHPDYRGENHARYIAYFHGQVREILTNYGRIDGLWFDLGGAPKDWDSESLFRMARQLQPWLIINNRGGLPGDFDTPEQHVGRFQFDRPWESCITLGTQWSWKPDDTLKPYEDAVQMLITCAIGDGNLALNTNPMPDGQIEPRQVEIFRQIGQWLARYGESIYGTRGGPFVAPDMGKRAFNLDLDRFAMPGGRWWGGSTHKGNTIYLHILRWPGETLQLPPIAHRILNATLLSGGAVELQQTDQGITVRVAPAARDPVDTIVQLDLDRPARDIPWIRPASESLAAGKPATASNWYQQEEKYAPGKAVDDDPSTRWGCDWGTHSAWLEVDLGDVKTFDRVWLSEPLDRVEEFAVEVKRGSEWKTLHRGTKIGEDCELKFAPVQGRFIRVNLLKTSDGPSLWEFQVFAPATAR
jgi:alpha-L-fucosidase